jgi:hypothetical protein
MPGFEVQHAYRSTRDGVQFGPWQAGETVELSEADAEWVCRDSPGCLLAAGGIVEATPEPKDGEERQKPVGANRQHRGSRNRGGS